MTGLEEISPLGALSPETIIQQIAQDNPRLATIMQMMAAQQGSNEKIASDSPEIPRQRSRSVSRLMEEVQTLRSVNRLLSRQAEILADALGACHCFGVDESCPDCHGDGVPGTFIPDRLRFEQVVMPVLINLKHWRAERAVQGKRPETVEVEQAPVRADDV